MKDIITTSCLAGTAAFFYKNIFNHILYYLGITPFLYRVEAASLVIPSSKANTFYGIIIGLFTDLILLVWFALLIGYILKVTGYDYGILKGAFVGASSWLIIYGFFAHSDLVALSKPSGLISGITSIFFDISMGIVIAYVYIHLKTRFETS